MLIRTETKILFFASIALLITILARSFIFSSLWLDETISYWVIKDGATEVFNRAVNFQGQSPLYYFILWAWTKVFGYSELSLRFPSLLALVAGLFFLFIIAKKLANTYVGFASLIAYLSLTPVLTTLSARPYALATLMCLVSVWGLLQWLEERRFFHLAIYFMASLLIFYLHYLFAAVFLLHTFLVIIYPSHKPKRSFWFASFALYVFCLPGLLQIATLYARKNSLHFAKDPTLAGLVLTYLPYYWLVYIGLSLLFVLVALKGTKLKFTNNFETPNAWVWQLAIFWWLSGPLLFFLYSLITGSSLFVDRYFVWHSAGAAFSLALIFNAITSHRAKYAAILMFTVLVLVREIDRRWVIEDWQTAAEFANQPQNEHTTAILVQPGLVEARQLSWLQDASKREYLLAPFAYYQISKVAIILPPTFESAELKAYFQEQVKPVLSNLSKAILISYQKNLYLRDFFAQQGFTVTQIAGNKALAIYSLRAD